MGKYGESFSESIRTHESPKRHSDQRHRSERERDESMSNGARQCLDNYMDRKGLDESDIRRIHHDEDDHRYKVKFDNGHTYYMHNTSYHSR